MNSKRGPRTKALAIEEKYKNTYVQINREALNSLRIRSSPTSNFISCRPNSNQLGHHHAFPLHELQRLCFGIVDVFVAIEKFGNCFLVLLVNLCDPLVRRIGVGFPRLDWIPNNDGDGAAVGD